MSSEVMRTHIVVPEGLIQEVDRVAGKRRRSHFVEEAIREKLSRQALGTALASTADTLVAAIAHAHGAAIVTGNTKDYPMPEISLLPLLRAHQAP